MKKLKTLFYIMLLLFITSSLKAKISLFVNGGYNTVSMQKVNDEIAKAADSCSDSLSNLGLTPSKEIKKITNGINFSGGVLYNLKNDVNLLASVEYLKPNDANWKVEWSGQIGGLPAKIDIEALYSTSLISPIVGINYCKKLTDKLSIDGILLAGYGFANLDAEVKSFIQAPGQPAEEWKKEIKASGENFVAQIALAANYSFTEKIFLFANIGYRIANISQLKYKENVDMDDDGVIEENEPQAGKPLKDSEGNIVPFDFSGIKFNIGIGVRF